MKQSAKNKALRLIKDVEEIQAFSKASLKEITKTLKEMQKKYKKAISRP